MARREPHGKLRLSLSPDDAPARGVGVTLRDARVRRGWSIDDCAQSLRIRASVLEAMEGGRFERLPNGAYALGFVRSYADFLGLDRDEIVRRVKAEAAALNTKTELVFPTPISEGRLPSGVILFVSVVLAVGAYGIWYYHTAEDRVPIPRVAAVPEQVAPAEPQAIAPTLPPPAPDETVTSANPAPDPLAAPTVPSPREPVQGAFPGQPVAPEPTSASQTAVIPAPARPAAATSASAAAATSVTATPDSASTPPRQYGEGDGRIVIKATGDSWVQVRDPAGNIVFSRILRAGESYNAPSQSGFLLATGSAGVLDILVDGKKAPPIGRPGFVRKDVPLDPERLLAGTAVPPENVRPAPAATPASDTPPASPAGSSARPSGG